jgi:hypothetical protein
MARTDGIDLRQGYARWMRVAHRVVSLLAAWAIFSSGAHSLSKSVFLAALLAVHLATARQMRRAAPDVPRIRLFENGTASLVPRSRRRKKGSETPDSGAVPAVLTGYVWTSRWVSVFPLQPLDGGRRVYCTVCRSLNQGDAYRRLRVLLRMRAGRDPAARWGWS